MALEELEYDVVLIPAEEGGYTVIVPALPGCSSEGDTEEEALENIKDAIKGWIAVAKKSGFVGKRSKTPLGSSRWSIKGI